MIGYVLAGSLGLVGLGSFLFHGTGTQPGDLLHTVSIPLLLLSVVAVAFVSREQAVRMAWPPMILFGVGLTVYLFSRTGVRCAIRIRCCKATPPGMSCLRPPPDGSGCAS